MQTKQAIRTLWDTLRAAPRNLSADERALVERFWHERLTSTTRLAASLGIFVALAAGAVAYLGASEAVRLPLTAGYGLLLVLLLFWRFVLPIQPGDERRFLLGTEAAFVAVHALALRVAVQNHAGPDVTSSLSLLLVAAGALAVVLSPFAGGLIAASALLYLGFGVAVWWGHDAALSWVLADAAAVMAAAIVAYARLGSLRREALAAAATRRLLAQNERLCQEAAAKEAATAREIQGAWTPPSACMQTRTLTASLYHGRQASLGGDWMVLRELPDGQLALLVVDATGKGLQAALTIHAVQTLWTNALAAAAFDPEAWLCSVNRTLFALGRRQTQAAAVGLALITPERLRYFSAGAVPLFVLTGEGDAATLTPVVARGNPLGLAEVLDLKPAEVDLGGLAHGQILVGTDRVFDRGVRIGKKQVLRLLSRLERDGEKALGDDGGGDEGKVLGVVRKRAS